MPGLNKEICIKCVNKHRRGFDLESNFLDILDLNDKKQDLFNLKLTMTPKIKQWENEDDFNWERGVIFCKSEFNRQWGREEDFQININETPPEWCLFVLEHLMATQKKTE